MTKNLIGPDPSQVPTNGSLGTMAFQDAEDVAVGDIKVGGGVTYADGTVQTTAPTAVAWGNLSGKPTSLGGYGITDALSLTGGSLTGGLVLAYSTPKLTFSDSSQTGGVGIFQWTSAGGQFKLLRNTAAAGDFSTSTTLLSYGATDVATFPSRPVFGTATPWDSSNLPNPLDKSGGTMTGPLTVPDLAVAGTGVSQGWSSATLGITSTAGAINSGRAYFYFKVFGKLVFFHMEVQVDSSGTASGGIRVTLPFTAALPCGFCGREQNVHGYAVTASMNAGDTNMFLYRYDNQFPVTSGGRILISGVINIT